MKISLVYRTAVFGTILSTVFAALVLLFIFLIAEYMTGYVEPSLFTQQH